MVRRFGFGTLACNRSVLLLRTAKVLFWAALLALHLSAIRQVWLALLAMPGEGGSLFTGTRALALTAATVFFILKIADVRWLRLNPGWRPAVASVMIVALLHVNVVARAASQGSEYSPAHFGAVLLVSTMLEVDVLRRSLARLALVRTPRRCQFAMHPGGDLGRRLEEDIFLPVPLFFLSRALPPRAPPIV